MSTVTSIDADVRAATKAETELHLEIDAIYANASDEDRQKAADITSSSLGVRVETITPEIGAVLYRDHNNKNRDIAAGKVRDYQGAMERGEWKLNHQGLAFYKDGMLADGQHRMGALALYGRPLRFVVFPNFEDKAIDTIDRAKGRTAGEALEMHGIEHGKKKAPIAKIVMEYTYELTHGARPRFSDPQIEAWVEQHDDLLKQALSIGDGSKANITDPCLSATEAALIAALMLLGGWEATMVVAYLAGIQQGAANYPESPTLVLSRLYMKAKHTGQSKARLTRKAKLALALKGAVLWVENKSVSRLSWGSKEILPSNVNPETAMTEIAGV